ncbi:DUF998 domain-containing protein [Streptomyces sp. 8L]|uniref:DUF998 domain-containing protein n=1 Tax=Streptomyces sp. 8L TaxID=2877242 RepID=UPI001CD729E2|nr:DUF998 domain-containing protein [Streptomyces sp. 8L]MCA1219042.1 DUF998 domain-containing protein [Streptomyces sp. 8L]
MRIVPWWTVVSSTAAPVLLVGGWSVAQVIQGPRYDPVSQSISVLGAYGAPGYWVLTGSLLALGACYLVTAAGLRGATRLGRAVLGGGGVTPIALTLVPAPHSGGSLRHGAGAAVGFALLALWPVLAVGRGGDRVPWGLRPIPASAASGVMWIGAAWFWVELHRQGASRMPGVAERVVTFSQALWPLIVVASCLRLPRALGGVGTVRSLAPAVRRVAPDGGSERLPGGEP